MFISEKKLSFPVLLALFILVSISTYFLKPSQHFAHIELTSPSRVNASFIWQASPSKTLCQERLVHLIHHSMGLCPDCKVQQQTCLANLNETQEKALSNKPLDFPSIQLHDGRAYFQSVQPQLALKTCEAAAKFIDHGQLLTCVTAKTLSPYAVHERLNFIQSIKVTFTSLLIAALSSWFACLLIVRKTNLQKITHSTLQPNVQKMHHWPTPRTGGLALFASLLCSLIVEKFFHLIAPHNPTSTSFFLLAGLPVFFAGIMEDIANNFGARERLVFSGLSAALGIVLFGYLIDQTDIGLLDNFLMLSSLAIGFTILGVSGFSNATNIIDGYNGLSSGYGVIALTAMAVIAFQLNDHLILYASVSLIGALLGFLYWNWPNGKLFLGDGGAYLMGFIMAELAVVMLGRNHLVSPWFTAMIMAYPIFETLFTIFRRLRIKNSSMHPDASHFHHLIYFKLLRAKQFNDPDKLMQLNNRVALLLLLPAIVAAILACLFWDSTAILMPLTLAGCVIYALVYRKLLSLPD
ncbi:Rfe UDP-N-acetylmuramyl pentapeptide phosphotransferase/UDP-N- acetylglucosamine-1-phosphate transferase [Methylophilaceae bacterium]